MEYLQLYRNYPVVQGFILNILLVSVDARRATILATADLIGIDIPVEDVMKDMRILISSEGLQYVIQENGDYPRWIVSKMEIQEEQLSDEFIGDLLGMIVVSGDQWYSPDVIRITGSISTIYGIELYAEVHERDLISRERFLISLIQKTESWNHYLQDYGYLCTYSISEDKSTQIERLDALQRGDYNYVIFHLDEYKNDVWNSLDLSQGETLETSPLWNMFENLSPYTWNQQKETLLQLYTDTML